MPWWSGDVVVVGGGPAGSVTAWWLARRGWRVCLLDKAQFPRDKPCGDGVTPRGVRTLRRLGLDRQVRPHAFLVEGARLWAAPEVDVVWRFGAHSPALPAYGYVVPRRILDATLLRTAQEAGAEVCEGVHVTELLQEDGRVTGVAGRYRGRRVAVYGRYVVVATGANVALMRRAGILRHAHHGIYAVRGYWHGVREVAPFLEFFFLPALRGGYAWVFPVDEATVNVGLGVFVGHRGTSPSLSEMLRTLLKTHPAFAARFQQARPLDKVRVYPLREDFPASPVWGWGWVAVGEAAGLVNPVTGEGIDLAMESAALAAWSLDWALRSDGESPRALWPYGWLLGRAFASTFQGLRRLRPWVMRPRALRIIIRQATGHPGLARRVMGIVLGTESPYSAFYPSTWWWLLRPASR